ncbi:MAG: HAD family phosphatase [Armatimonadetes bacterium]|nr:HAD family phosphatase [Armatimonadota bacterium]
MSYRMVAIDADGTFVNGRDHVNPRVREAVAAAKARGVDVLLATGRSYDGAKLLCDDLGHDLGLILVNGAVLAEGLDEPPFSRHMLSVEAGRFAAEHLLAAGYQPFVYEDPLLADRIAMGPGETLMPRFISERPEAHHRCDLLAWLDHPTLVVVAAGDETGIKATAAALRGHLDGQAAVVPAYYQSGDMWVLTVVNARCNKAAALAEWAARRGIGLDQTMAIGDGDNDVEMVAEAGLGVAMGNACAAVLDAADVVVADNDHDGVAEAIERFILSA